MADSKNCKTIKATLAAAIAFMLLLSISFLLMPTANRIALNDEKNGLLYFSGVLFWLSVVMETVMLIIYAIKSKKMQSGDRAKGLPGAFRFFTNKAARIIDPLAAIALIGFAVCVFITDKYVTYVFLAAALFLVQLHCVVNGRSFEYINS